MTVEMCAMNGNLEFELTTQHRDYPRWEVDFGGTLICGAQMFPCQMQDISATGAAIEIIDPPPLGTKCAVEIPGVGRFDAKVVRSEEKNAGLCFLISAEQQETLIARLESLQK